MKHHATLAIALAMLKAAAPALARTAGKVAVLGTALAALLTAACTPTNVAKPAAEAATTAPAFAEEYRIGVADQLSVNVFQNPEVSVQVPVRPDGRITVPIIGDVMVGGETPTKVAANITELLAKTIRDPVVTVTVTGINSVEYDNRIRVTGAIRTPRSVPYRQSMTVLDLILESGGVTEFADEENSILYRAGGNRLPIDLEAILERGDLTTNYPLQPGDVITVPEQRF